MKSWFENVQAGRLQWVPFYSDRGRIRASSPQGGEQQVQRSAPAFVPSQRPECQHRASLQLPLLKVGYGCVAPCLVGLCSFCFFLCKQRMKVTRPFQEGSQEDVSVFFLAGHKSDGNDMMIFRLWKFPMHTSFIKRHFLL